MEEEGYDISCIFGVFEQDVEEILVKIDTEERQDVESELTERFEKDVLRYMRGKIFELAKEKIIRGIENNRSLGLLDDNTMLDGVDQSLLLTKCIAQWEPVTRRAKHKLTSDAIHFLLFVLGQNEKFPTNLVKSSSLDKGELIDPKDNEDLLSQFNRDITAATGPSEFRLVYTDSEKERHSITIPCGPTSAPQATSCVITELHPEQGCEQEVSTEARKNCDIAVCASRATTVPDNELTTTQKCQLPEKAPGSEIVTNVCEKPSERRANPDNPSQADDSGSADGDSQPDNTELDTNHAPPTDNHVRPTGCRGICGNCGAAILLWECTNKAQHGPKPVPVRESRTVATSTDDLQNSYNMAGRSARSADYDPPISRSEFDAYTDYASRMACDTAQRVEEILNWKKTINTKVNKIEASVKRMDNVSQAQRRDLWEKLEELKIGDQAPAPPPYAQRSQVPVVSKPPTTQHGSSKYGASTGFESIWDIETVNEQPVRSQPKKADEVIITGSNGARSKCYTSTPRVGPVGPDKSTKRAGKDVECVSMPPRLVPSKPSGVTFGTPMTLRNCKETSVVTSVSAGVARALTTRPANAVTAMVLA